MPTPAEGDKRCYKMPYNATEILKNECEEIENILFSETLPTMLNTSEFTDAQRAMADCDMDVITGTRMVGEICVTRAVTSPKMNSISNAHFPYLNKLFSVLLDDSEINEILAGYLQGIANNLIDKKPGEFMSFLMEKEIYIDKLVQNINNKSISEFLQKVLCEEREMLPAFEEKFKQKRMQIIKGFLLKLDSHNHMLDILNACYIAVQGISSIEAISDKLSNAETVKLMYSMSFSGNQYSLRATILIVMHLLKKVPPQEFGDIIVEQFDKLIHILKTDVHGKHPSCWGNMVMYAGVDKYRIIEFIAMLIQSKIPVIIQKMKDCKIMSCLMSLFLPYFNNSILTTKIKQILIDIVQSNNNELISTMIIEQDIASLLLMLCNNHELDFPSKRTAPKPTHITLYRIVEVFNKSSNPLLKAYLESNQNWKNIEEKYFADLIKRLKMNIREDDIKEESLVVPEQTINEKEEEVARALTEYPISDEKFTVTEDLFEEDKVESPIKPHTIEKEEKKEELPVEKVVPITVEKTMESSKEFVESTYWKVDNNTALDEAMVNEF